MPSLPRNQMLALVVNTKQQGTQTPGTGTSKTVRALKLRERPFKNY